MMVKEFFRSPGRLTERSGSLFVQSGVPGDAPPKVAPRPSQAGPPIVRSRPETKLDTPLLLAIRDLPHHLADSGRRAVRNEPYRTYSDMP